MNTIRFIALHNQVLKLSEYLTKRVTYLQSIKGLEREGISVLALWKHITDEKPFVKEWIKSIELEGYNLYE